MRELADKDWRIRHLYHIVDKANQRVLFSPNFAQDMIRNSPKNRRIVLKCRQIGVSTGELLNALDTTIFTENFNTVILAHEDKVIQKLFRIPRRAYDFMDPRIQPVLDRGGGSKYAMYFPQVGSRISVALEAVGETINWLHISEAALIKDPARIKATLECVPLNGIVTYESTPRGLGNLFYKLYNDHDEVHQRFFFPWYMFPEYTMPVVSKLILDDEEKALCIHAKAKYGIIITQGQIQFRRFKKATLKEVEGEDGERITFEQEYPEDEVSCFLSSGSKVIDLNVVKQLIDEAGEPLYIKNGIRVYSEPSNKGVYVMGADTSEGIGKDPSTCVMIDVVEKEVVATFRGQLKPMEFAEKLMEMTNMYTKPGHIPPYLGVERNNHGHAVILWLNEELQHPNLYRHTDDKLGWHTNLVTRPVMMNTFLKCVEKKSVSFNDKKILSECLTLVDNNGKIEAEVGETDDMIFAAGIAVQLFLNIGGNGLYDNFADKIRI